MTKTKLEIIGPYTLEHTGPFCTRDGQRVRIVTLTDGSENFPIIGFLPAFNSPSVWDVKGNFYGTKNEHVNDLMNAREVPVAREFWVNEYKTERGKHAHLAHSTPDDAMGYSIGRGDFIRTIHVREVLPGDE